MQMLVENCFSRSSNNPDRFADCLIAGQKKTADLNESLQFKMVFLTRSVQNCVANRTGTEQCEKEAINLGKSIVDNLLKQV